MDQCATISRYDAAADTASDAYVNALHGKDKVAEGAGQAADQAKQQVGNAPKTSTGQHIYGAINPCAASMCWAMWHCNMSACLLTPLNLTAGHSPMK
jgi:hypothetical protein